MAVSILKQVMEEKLDASNVELASVVLPPAGPVVPVEAACHYVPGGQNKPQFKTYTKAEVEAVIARMAPASS